MKWVPPIVTRPASGNAGTITIPSVRTPATCSRTSEITSGSSGKCPRRVESLRLTKPSEIPFPAARAFVTTSRLRFSAAAASRLRVFVSTYTAGACCANAHWRSSTDQRVSTGMPATDCVPVGSSSSTTRMRTDAATDAATFAAGTSTSGG
jgi:hypothetical protein